MELTSKAYFQEITFQFEQLVNEDIAAGMEKYMRNQFNFFGIKAPIRRDTQRAIIKNLGLPTIEQLPALMELMWADEHREIQYFAMDILDKLIKKVDPSFIAVLEKLITTKSWWDTVDMIASKFIGKLLSHFPEMTPEYPDKWMASNNMWLQRTAILFQLKYKKETNADLLFDYTLQLRDSKEFFIQKATGWALREYSKTNWELVLDFIETNDLVNLTEREGLKWMKQKGVL